MPADLWEAKYNQRVMRQDFTVQDLMMEHQAMSYALSQIQHSTVAAMGKVGPPVDLPAAMEAEVREVVKRKLDEYRAAA